MICKLFLLRNWGRLKRKKKNALIEWNEVNGSGFWKRKCTREGEEFWSCRGEFHIEDLGTRTGRRSTSEFSIRTNRTETVELERDRRPADSAASQVYRSTAMDCIFLHKSKIKLQTKHRQSNSMWNDDKHTWLYKLINHKTI